MFIFLGKNVLIDSNQILWIILIFFYFFFFFFDYDINVVIRILFYIYSLWL